MIFTFYAAQGKSVGASLVEEDKIDLAKELMDKAAAKGVELLLPSDVVVADNFAPDAATQTVSVDAIPDGWMGLDIGPDSIETFNTALSDCKTVRTPRPVPPRAEPPPGPAARARALTGNPIRWCGTARWAGSSSTPSRRAPSRWPTPWPG